MGIKLLDFILVALDIFVLSTSTETARASLPGPQREVVSIYNDDLTTPKSRVPYFIEVYRCVKADHNCDQKTGYYPVPWPLNETGIEIVVPDLTNNYRGPHSELKFYKYVVYNHTSCQCGKSPDGRTPNGTIATVNDFKKKYKDNPPNLLRQFNYCNSPQPRYKLHPDHSRVFPEFKYLTFNQCLPGCVVESNKTSHQRTKLLSSRKKDISLTDDVSCVAYDAPFPHNPSSYLLTHAASNLSLHNPSPLPANEKRKDSLFGKEHVDYETLVYIGSSKLILAATLLSLVLFAILIMDFTLCRHKKGFFYSLVGCNNDKDNFGKNCTGSNKNENTVV